jgi:glyoxylase-like metal-dependent hydrolase (beta-lactamase superfamily II)
VLFSGDALVTLDNATARTGPQPVRWFEDAAQEQASFERLRSIDVAVVYPGHGEPWRRR